MSKKFYQEKSFLILNKIWQEKAKKSGFRDIETPMSIKQGYINKEIFNVDINIHKIMALENLKRFVNYTEEKFSGDELLGGFYSDSTDKIILEKHIEGLPDCQIVNVLASKKMMDPNSEVKDLGKTQIGVRLKKLYEKANIEPVEFK